MASSTAKYNRDVWTNDNWRRLRYLRIYGRTGSKTDEVWQFEHLEYCNCMVILQHRNSNRGLDTYID